MKDYIKEGLSQRLGPPLIYDKICKELEKPYWTKEERKELMRQKEKAEILAYQTRKAFKFPR